MTCVLDGSSSGSSSITSSTSSNSRDFQVQAILTKRTLDGNVEYLVKWLGWASKYNSWLDVADMDGCSNLIEQFNALN